MSALPKKLLCNATNNEARGTMSGFVDALNSVDKEVWGFLGTLLGFSSSWLTQRATIKSETARDERRRVTEREADVKQHALKFINNVVSAAEAMSYITFRANQNNLTSVQVTEYKNKIVLYRVKIQSEQIAISLAHSLLADNAKTIRQEVERNADEIDTAIVYDEASGTNAYPKLGSIFVDTNKSIIEPLATTFATLLSSGKT